MMNPRNPLVVTAVGLLAVLCGAAWSAQEEMPPGRDRAFSDEELARATRIQKEFQEAGTALAETHAAAVKKPELAEPLEKLRKAMEEEMIRLAPERKDRILRRYAVHEQMGQLEKNEKPTAADKEAYQALLLEFTNLSEELGDLPKQAVDGPKVKEEREKYHKALLAVMTEMNPQVPALMQQQKKSISEVSELEAELLRRHGGAEIEIPSSSKSAPASDAAKN